MKTLIKKEFRLTRRILLIWMVLVLVLCVFSLWEFLSLKDNLGELMIMVENFPEILKIMFGVTGDLRTAEGWYSCIYFWVALFDFSFAIYLGISDVYREIARSTHEQLFTLPLSRRQIVTAKAVAGIWNLLFLSLFSGLCNYLTAALPLGGISLRDILCTTLGLFLTALVLFFLALWVAAFSRTYPSAIRRGTGMILFFFALYMVIELYHLPFLWLFTPLEYFEVNRVLAEGLSLPGLLVSAFLIVLSLLSSPQGWEARDL